MAPKGFLEELYLGRIDRRDYPGGPAHISQGKVTIILDRYRHILKDYPSEELERQGCLPPEMLRRMGEMGLFGLIIPVRYGGLGLNLHEYLWLIERMVGLDFSASLVSLAHLSIGIKGIVLFGTDSQKDRYLVSAAAGETIFSFALTEPLVGSDAQSIQTRAELSEDGQYYILNGRKTYITNANYAGAFTTFARMNPGQPGNMGAFIVETGWEGVKIGKDMPKMGLKASSTAAVILRDVRVPVANLLGKPGDGFKIAMTILNFGRLALGAASAGTMSTSLADMLARSSSRMQFGHPIRSYPLIQEKLVRARVHQVVSTSMNDWVAQMLEQDPLGPYAVETSHCKLYGTTRGWETVYDALQVAGGAGYLTTHPYEKRMRDFRVTTVFEGTTEIHSIYPAVHLLRRAARSMLGTGRGWGNVWRAIRGIMGPTGYGASSNDRDVRRAVRFCGRVVRSIRKLLFAGLIFRGRKVFEEQFLLRRISLLSLSCFGILSLIRRLEIRSMGNALSEDDRVILRYALEEAKEFLRHNGRFTPSRLELHHEEMMRRMVESAGQPEGP
jgi:acyl-CoA dehydrogenase family protein 9